MLMDYRIKRVGQSDELEHALFGIGKKKSSSSSGSGSGQQGAKKGSTWSNHLYIARQKAGDGWRYFYSQAELNAAKAKGAAKQAAKTVGDTARKGLATVKRAAADAKKYTVDVNNTRNRYKEAINIASVQAEDARRRAKTYDKLADSSHNDAERNRNTSEMARLNSVASDNRKDKEDYDIIEKVHARKALDHYAEEEKRRAKADKSYSAMERRAGEAAEGYDAERKFNESIDKRKYLLGSALNASEKVINKGKSAASKLIGDTKDAAGKAITTASDKAKNLANKGKAAVDKLGKVLSGEYHKEVDLEGDRINEAMIKSNRTAKRLSGLDDTDDNALLTYTSKGGRAQKKADETLEYRAKQIYNDYEKNNSTAYKLSKSIAGAKDKFEDAKDAASDKAKNLADKGKAAVDKLGKVLSGEYHKEVDLEGDRINEAMVKSNRTAKRLAGVSNIDKDNELLTYTGQGGRAQKKADEAMDYLIKRIDNEWEKGQSPYKVSKAIAGAKDKVEESKAAVSKSIEKAQEDFYETRRDVREFAAKAKNFVTDKTYRNDKTYRDMVDGVKSMQEDLKSIDAYIRELKASPKMTPSIEKEIKEARALQDEIGNTMVSVRREVEKYKNN